MKYYPHVQLAVKMIFCIATYLHHKPIIIQIIDR